MNSPLLTIDVVSDLVCPWCYIGKRKLEMALALPDAARLPKVVVHWHPFQLNPDLATQGVSRKQYLDDKFGGPERAVAAELNLQRFSRSEPVFSSGSVFF